MKASAATDAAYPQHMATAAATTAKRLAALCNPLRGQVVAGVRIHDARAEVTPGAVEPIIRLTLLLDDPEDGRDTWPMDAMREMESRAWDEAARLGLPEWVYVKHVPLSDAAGSFPHSILGDR
jgi:hypothetical protein